MHMPGMTNLGTIILLIVCVGIGYVLEPIIFSGDNLLQEKTADTAAGDTSGTAPDGTPGLPPAPAAGVDLTKITPEDFPEKVTLKAPHTISDAGSGITMTLEKGSMVKPVRIEGTDLVIQPAGIPVESKINIDRTNFKELAVPKMLDRLRNASVEPGSTPPAPIPAPDATPEPAPPVTPPAPGADPAPAPTTTPATARLGESAIIALLKKDVQDGNVSEFKTSQVTSWEAGGDMEFDGDTYQTGRVTFEADTILGVQQHEAIALIEHGKVYKWIWAKTKLDMR